MLPARIAELLEPYVGKADERLAANDLERISTYIDILRRWNARINLTSIRDEEQIVTRHFGESLFAARILFPGRDPVGTAALGCPAGQSSAATDSNVAQVVEGLHNRQVHRGSADLQGRTAAREEGASAPAVADVGSGAGFPGIPIKLWAPAIRLTLIESNQKKATFLKEVARTLTLMDIDIQAARAETLPASACDIVTLRAVERFESILPIAARLVAPGGRLVLLIGCAQRALAKSTLPNFTWQEPIPIPSSQARILAIATKTGSGALGEPRK